MAKIPRDHKFVFLFLGFFKKKIAKLRKFAKTKTLVPNINSILVLTILSWESFRGFLWRKGRGLNGRQHHVNTAAITTLVCMCMATKDLETGRRGSLAPTLHYCQSADPMEHSYCSKAQNWAACWLCTKAQAREFKDDMLTYTALFSYHIFLVPPIKQERSYNNNPTFWAFPKRLCH